MSALSSPILDLLDHGLPEPPHLRQRRRRIRPPAEIDVDRRDTPTSFSARKSAMMSASLPENSRRSPSVALGGTAAP